jgi:hypothetical protein
MDNSKKEEVSLTGWWRATVLLVFCNVENEQSNQIVPVTLMNLAWID